MSSFTRRIQRSVKRFAGTERAKRLQKKEGKPVGVHFGGRGSRLGEDNEGDKCLLARVDREARRAAGAA